MRTSISDYPSYRNACHLAATTGHFHRFRQDPAYTQILEHVTPEQGRVYKSIILGRPSFNTEAMVKHASSDSVGGAVIDPTLDWCPSTLRYIKVLGDLQEEFGPLDGMTIGEIGGGYGGQAKVIQDLYPSVRYSIFDLPEAQALADRFLGAFGYASEFPKMGQGWWQFDLVISNYAFSELDRYCQARYTDEVLDRAKLGYVTFNVISDKFGVDSMSADEFIAWLKTRKSYRIIDEKPLTSPGNFIAVWRN